MKPISLLFVLVTVFVLAACSQTGVSEETSAGGQPSIDSESATNIAESTDAFLTPIEVTYITPGQGEGPYYPLEKLDDRDNDLTVLDGAAGAPAGEVIEFTGKVYDAAGMPVPGAVVEIWQTDESGVYLHPGDPGTEQRDRNFQFYGEEITAADGSYSFRTILPGHYEPRPRHIHVKVRLEDNELLTTQFYFEGDPELANEAMFNQAGGEGVRLIISLTEGQDANGNPIFIGRRDIILNVDLFG
jgi:protocatechuate 3,4-dioxygenase beta subunit